MNFSRVEKQLVNFELNCMFPCTDLISQLAAAEVLVLSMLELWLLRVLQAPLAQGVRSQVRA